MVLCERLSSASPSPPPQEASEQSADLLAKARAQMEEQDDEIKRLHEVILNAKCHAIRDAQLREKKEVKVAMDEEEVGGQGRRERGGGGGEKGERTNLPK